MNTKLHDNVVFKGRSIIGLFVFFTTLICVVALSAVSSTCCGASAPAVSAASVPAYEFLPFPPLASLSGALLVDSARYVPLNNGSNQLSLSGRDAFAAVMKPVIDTSKSYTVIARIKLDRTDGNQTFASIDGKFGSAFFLQSRNNGEGFAFVICYKDGGHAYSIAESNSRVEWDKWYTLAGVYDASKKTASLYVDGLLQDTVPVVSTFKANGMTVFGRALNDKAKVDFVDGLIGNVKLYQSALSEDEIVKLSGVVVVEKPALLVEPAVVRHPVSPNFYGLMTEEISNCYDGGLYAELIRNRAFQDDDHSAVHWSLLKHGSADAQFSLDQSQPVPNTALTRCLKVDVKDASGTNTLDIVNDGYYGIPVKPSTKYDISFYAKSADGFASSIGVSLQKNSGATIVSQSIPSITGEWAKYTISLTTPATIAASKDNVFALTLSSRGTVYFNQVSVFPPTYKNEPNGVRADIMDLMAGLKPTFLRFPGGNYLEGDTIDTRFDWKKTLGPIETRPGHMGCWGYRSSDGFGMMEFLRWCEDLNMEPVLGVYAGYSLRGDHIDAGPDLAPYVQDALDEIEFVNGASSTKWGAVRAQLGHPEPFNLPYVEIGNEDNFDRSGSYEGRFAQFFDAIKAKYPNIQLIATAPVQSRHADILDYHLYSGSKDMISRFRQYDDANRATQKIFVGEWATTKDGYPTPDMNAAIGDAVWLLGLERNSDITVMEAYAPLLVNADRDSGPWGLIGFDGLTAFGSPSYWVQSVFAANEGNVVVGSQITGISGLFENVTLDQKTHTLYIKVVNAKGFEQAAPINIMGASAASIKASITTISSTDLQAVNSAADPNSVAPKTTELSVKLPQFTYAFPADSATVIKLILP